ncbi:hypothetical protein DPMN_049339 [Dreissena polymorpha]|uniref:Uncharacterized protein n=1 Tax=Dreissena polymorpha TaxID=45954 RepID=A0A9D4HL77_DREPO|nr:hypothetical protein DPMN_049331 [Dreissena polymorpha]KAH3723549.1 hypothetical protein DPMN_049339 [Dreissena polymorpha]
MLGGVRLDVRGAPIRQIRVAVNTNAELCVSDNLKNAVLFLRTNGELKNVYDGYQKTDDITLVKTPQRSRPRTAHLSITRTGTVSFKLASGEPERAGRSFRVDPEIHHGQEKITAV